MQAKLPRTHTHVCEFPLQLLPPGQAGWGRPQGALTGWRGDQKAKCKEIFASGKQNLVSNSRAFPSRRVAPLVLLCTVSEPPPAITSTHLSGKSECGKRHPSRNPPPQPLPKNTEPGGLLFYRVEVFVTAPGGVLWHHRDRYGNVLSSEIHSFTSSCCKTIHN